jgi:hypothetical protein
MRGLMTNHCLTWLAATISMLTVTLIAIAAGDILIEIYEFESDFSRAS